MVETRPQMLVKWDPCLGHRLHHHGNSWWSPRLHSPLPDPICATTDSSAGAKSSPVLFLVSPLCAQSCPTLCSRMDCSLPGSSAHGISQARTLEWVAIFSSRGSSQLRDQTHVSCVGRRILSHQGSPKKSIQVFKNIRIGRCRANYKRSWRKSNTQCI